MSKYYPVFDLTFTANSPSKLHYDIQRLYPTPKVVKKKNSTVIVFGSPIIGENINHSDVARKILDDEFLSSEFINSLNGEFLLVYVNFDKNIIQIANDRYTSIPVFYYSYNGTLKISIKYIDIARRIKQDGLWRLNKDVFFEFLWFRRLYGNHTYDLNSRYLKAARILTYNGNKVNLNTYWKPDFNKDTSSSINDFSHELAFNLHQSLTRKTSDISIDQAGLFLSGGMDTRAVLAAFISQDRVNTPTCFTVGYSKQGEYETARKLTELASIPHRFIQLQHDYIVQHMKDKIELSGGMYNQFASIFLGYSEQITPYSKVLFHGHGLDYMFQGMYLPSKAINFFGKPTYFKNTTKLNSISDFSQYYTHNIDHRFRQLDIGNFLLPKQKERMLESLYSSINKVVDEGHNVCNDNFDLWEYMLIHTMSRHYSQMDVSGIGTNGDQRKIANDIDMMDLYLKMPLEVRKYAKVMRGALSILNPEFAKMKSANTGFRINASPASLTKHFAFYKALRIITGNQKFRHPQAKDRTWADSGQQMSDLIELQHMASVTLRSEYIREAMPYLDWDKIETHTRQWLSNGSEGGANFLMNIISIDSLLRNI
jgi:hypothetical protein